MPEIIPCIFCLLAPTKIFREVTEPAIFKWIKHPPSPKRAEAQVLTPASVSLWCRFPIFHFGSVEIWERENHLTSNVKEEPRESVLSRNNASHGWHFCQDSTWAALSTNPSTKPDCHCQNSRQTAVDVVLFSKQYNWTVTSLGCRMVTFRMCCNLWTAHQR